MKLIDMTVTDFASEVDSNSPAPGGGSVSALASDIGVGLARMMAHLSFGKKKFEALADKTKEEFKVRFDKLGEIRTELSTLVDKDTESFNEFMKALKLPKETDEEKVARAKAMEEATIFSIEVPYKTAKLFSCKWKPKCYNRYRCWNINACNWYGRSYFKCKSKFNGIRK